MGSRGSLHGGIIGASLGSTADSDGFQRSGFGKTVLPPGHRMRKAALDSTGYRPTQSAETLEVTGKSSASSTLRRPAAMTLPALPPAFSRPLSPGSQVRPSEQLQQHLLQKQAAQTWHPESDDSPMADSQSPTQSSRASRPGVSRRPVWTGGEDPLLRIVPLGQWLKELGLINESPGAGFPDGRHQLDSASQENLFISGRSWLGFAADSANHAQRAKLDRAFVEHLAMLAKSRFLPLEEVAEDLQIWRLKLHDRAARKRLADLFGRNLLKRQGFQDDLFLRRRAGDGDDEGLAGKGADGSNRRSSWNPEDLFGDSSDGGVGGGRSGGGGGSAAAYHKAPPKATQRTGDTDSGDGASAGVDGDDADRAQAQNFSQSELDDEEKKKRRRTSEEEEDEEARKRRLAEEEANRKKLQAPEGQAAQDGGPKGKSREYADFGVDDTKKTSKEVEEEEPLPRGLFKIKDYGPRPSTEELPSRTLFPRVKVRKEKGLDSDEEEEEEEEEVEMPRPPATAPARRPIRGNLAEEFREAVRIAWERAYEEVEAAWEARSGGRRRSVRLAGEDALGLGSTESSLDDPLDINHLAVSDPMTSEAEVSDAPEETEDGLQSRESLPRPSEQRHGEQEDYPGQQNENLEDQASGNRTPDGLLDGMAGTDDLSESRKRLHRQRYGRRLQARTRDSAARNRARQCWMQRVESCRKSLGSLTALGAFAEGATDALRSTVDRVS